MKLWILVVVIVLLNTEDICAQVTYSPYSFYGIGIIRHRNSPYNRAIGGTGFGTVSTAHLNVVNPAAINNIVGVSFQTNSGVLVERGTYSNNNSSTKYTNGTLTSLDAWFRLSKKWSTVVGYTPYSFINYNVETKQNYLGTLETVRLSGSGGYNQMYWTHAYKVYKDINIGVSGIYTQGTQESQETITSGVFGGASNADNISASGLGADFGIQYSIKLFKEMHLSAGATYTTAIRMNKTQSATLYRNNYQLLKKEIIDNRGVVIPKRVGVGIGVRNNRFNFSSDVAYMYWEKAELKDVQAKNTLRWSAGGEYILKQNTSTFRSPMAVRFGFYSEKSYIRITSSPFNDWGLTGGLGIPVADNHGMLHVTYQYHQTGTSGQNLINQSAQTFIIDFTYRDIWGIRRKSE